MAYIDGLVAAVSSDKRGEYREFAVATAAIFKEYGAEKVVECWGDDVPEGKVTSLPKAVKCKADETVVFSWIWWPSKEARDTAWGKLEKDERMSPETNPMPFDGQRMIFGGFEVIVEE